MSQDQDRNLDPAFPLHRGGKIEVRPTVRIRDGEGLALAYTPGVARVSNAIACDRDLVFDYTWKSNTVLVVSDGTAVLGLGNIGPEAALPVMEGKALLFKEFAHVDAVPICLDCTDVDEVVETVARIAPAFGGINLEDISAPRCFAIERQLDERLDIPVFHDDQHGTAIVVLAALEGAVKLTGRTLTECSVVISGAGAAGTAVAQILVEAGVSDVVVVDSTGILGPGRTDLNIAKLDLRSRTNPRGLDGDMALALEDADVYIGVSGGTVAPEALANLAPEAIIFSLANPEPEIHPDVAHTYAAVVATGRSDFPNQINNVLAFPGIFRGALDVRARRITESMHLAAADAIAEVVGDRLAPDFIVPSPFDRRVAVHVAEAVAQAAIAAGVARIPR